jgi:adenine C2-methylase RlmN of 23S rRNA A2503 and tRNA A37
MTAGEILEQVVHADRILAQEYLELKRNHLADDGPLPKIELVRNIVFMGMGEVSVVVAT